MTRALRTLTVVLHGAVGSGMRAWTRWDEDITAMAKRLGMPITHGSYSSEPPARRKGFELFSPIANLTGRNRVHVRNRTLASLPDTYLTALQDYRFMAERNSKRGRVFCSVLVMPSRPTEIAGVLNTVLETLVRQLKPAHGVVFTLPRTELAVNYVAEFMTIRRSRTLRVVRRLRFQPDVKAPIRSAASGRARHL